MTTATAPSPLQLVAQEDKVERLTRREREVLGQIAAALDNASNSRRLWIGGKTLERHVQSIFAKLDLPQDCGRHRRVCAVLAYLRSPVSRSAALEAQRMRTAGPATPLNRTR